MDENGDYYDWIELYYNLIDTLNLEGYFMTDNFTDPQKWMFPNIEIHGEGHLILWADNQVEQGDLHTNFKLSASGEDIALFDQNLNLVDNITYEEQTVDISYGRETDGSYFWQFFNNL